MLGVRPTEATKPGSCENSEWPGLGLIHAPRYAPVPGTAGGCPTSLARREPELPLTAVEGGPDVVLVVLADVEVDEEVDDELGVGWFLG
jgi:hypothetical protein